MSPETLTKEQVRIFVREKNLNQFACVIQEVVGMVT